MITDARQIHSEELTLGLNTAEQTNEQARATAGFIARQVEEREGRPLRVALAGRLGSVVGSFLEHCVFWSGRSTHCENGWFHQNRDEIFEKCGCDRREQTLARKVLRGDREWKNKTFKLLYEKRPSRRQAVHFRVDLLAVAEFLEIALPDELRPESPYKATESLYRASELPNRASKSPDRAASALSSAVTSPLSSSSQKAIGDFQDSNNEEEVREALALLRRKMTSSYDGMVRRGEWDGISQTLINVELTKERLPASVIEEVVASAAKSRSPKLAGVAS